MSSKRKVTLGSEEGPNARERKKQKVADARTIAVQRAAPVNAVAGPSGLGNSNIDSESNLTLNLWTKVPNITCRHETIAGCH